MEVRGGAERDNRCSGNHVNCLKQFRWPSTNSRYSPKGKDPGLVNEFEIDIAGK